MDDLETPYDDEVSVEYIECMVCNKSIRGDTLYKLHLTTAGHMKKEDALVAQGCAVRKHTVPDFVDFIQYLKYLKIDEPVIGLNFLEEVPCINSDPQPGPRYNCKLCDSQANLPNMVHHVIGRKHRQKYLQTKRPDLVNWDTSMMNRSAKIIRAKAEVVERQDGQGTPKPMKKNRNVGKSNISTVPPRQRQNIGRNIPHRLAQEDETLLHSELRNSWDEYSLSEGRPLDYQNNPPFHPDDSCVSARAERQTYSWKDPLSSELMNEDLQRADYRERDVYRQECMESNFPREYQEENVEDPQGRHFYEPHRRSFREEMPHRQANCTDQYMEEGPSYRRPYPESSPPKQFYSEEVRHGQVCSVEKQPSLRVFPNDSQPHWPQDRESGRIEGLNGAGRQGYSETEARRAGISNIIQNDLSYDKNHLFQIISDYRQKIKEPHQEEANHGPIRTGPPNSQGALEFSRTLSNIPEPFRRFLKGPANNEDHRKRKRKSQFSDATEEEVQRAKEMFRDQLGPLSQRFLSHSRTVSGPSGPLNPEIRGPQTPDSYVKSQSPNFTECYQRGGSKPLSEFPEDTEGVFDMLKNIEIENVEEADFLKNKLCSVMKEFQAKKLDKQNSQGRADFSNIKQDPQTSERHQYERPFGEDLERRQPEELNLQEVCRGRGWDHREQRADAQMQEYYHPAHGEPRSSSRSRFEEMFKLPELNRPTHAPHLDEPVRYPERLQESMKPRDNRPVTDKFFDPRSSASPYHIEQGYGKHRGSRHSSSLDKITSTLLELVARK